MKLTKKEIKDIVLGVVAHRRPVSVVASERGLPIELVNKLVYLKGGEIMEEYTNTLGNTPDNSESVDNTKSDCTEQAKVFEGHEEYVYDKVINNAETKTITEGYQIPKIPEGANSVEIDLETGELRID